jgi:hypothetical protein
MEHALTAQPNKAAVLELLCDLLSGKDLPSLGTALGDPEAIGPVLQFAEQERILPALAQRAAGSPALSKSTRAVLATHYEANRRRNAAFRGVLLELGEAAAAARIDLIALKGATWLLEDTDGSAAWRQMVDIDVLVPREQFAAMSALLERMNYSNVSRRKDGNFHHSFYHPATPVLVELHKDPGWQPHLLPNDVLFASSREIVTGIRVPEPWMRVFHAIIHWQIQDQAYSRRMLPLKEPFELACFLRRSDVDWPSLAAHAARVGMTRECEAALASASILLGADLPVPFTVTPEARRWIAAAVARRSSPFQTWLATELWRTGTLWRCEKVRYRCAVHGSKPWATALVLGSARLGRLPLIAARLAGILIKLLRGRFREDARLVSFRRAFDLQAAVPGRSAPIQ